jgi:hypothetical protein
MQDVTVTVHFEKNKQGVAIATIKDMLLGDSASRNPEQLRHLSNLLRRIAKDAEQLDVQSETKKYDLI